MSGNEKVYSEIVKIKKKLQEEIAEAGVMRGHLELSTNKLNKLSDKLLALEKVLALFQTVAKETQKGVEEHISKLVTIALDAVFDDSYVFKMNFENRRNKTECDLLFERDGESFKPLDSAGGGTIDVASLALRFAIWSAQKTRPTIILDEPCKFVSRDRLPYVVEMFELLSKKLGVQIIMVSHIDGLKSACDKLITVNNGEVSEDKEI